MARDFRTWAGTILTATALQEIDTFTSQRQAQKKCAEGHRIGVLLAGYIPAICRRYYVHPEIIEAYLDRTLSEKLQRSRAWLKRSSNGLRQIGFSGMEGGRGG